MKILIWLLIVVNAIIVVYCIPYLVDVISGKTIIDAWNFALGTIILDVFLVSTILILFIKKENKIAIIALATTVLYTLVSFLGTKIPPILGVILPVISTAIYYSRLKKIRVLQKMRDG